MKEKTLHQMLDEIGDRFPLVLLNENRGLIGGYNTDYFGYVIKLYGKCKVLDSFINGFKMLFISIEEPKEIPLVLTPTDGMDLELVIKLYRKEFGIDD